MLEYIPIPLLKLVYPITEPNLTRDRPLKVLCLGLGRTGTESLHNALGELGYHDVHHGWRVASTSVGEAVQWYRLALAKFKTHDESFLSRSRFDKVIGDCEAVTDLPSAAFAVEMLRAYPEAKVILNRRTDVDSWYQSQVRTIDQLYRVWPDSVGQWFNSELFWLGRLVTWTVQRLSDYNFQQNGMQLYHNHYAMIEDECKRQGRSWLSWTVEDGWDPLCDFLNKSKPEIPFPHGNELGAFAKKRETIHHGRRVSARRNMMATGVLIAAAVALLAFRYKDNL